MRLISRRRSASIGSVPSFACSSADFLELVQEPGIDVGHLRDLAHAHALRQRVADVLQPLGMRRHQALGQDARLDVVRASTRLPVSSERTAFSSACLKVRPMAITSPTDFICGPSDSSAPGNFSNCHLGILTTT